MMKPVTGIWRSYKVFCFSGNIERQDDSDYLQFAIDEAGTISITHSKNPRNPTIIGAEQWHIEEIKKRQFIYAGKKQVYEIITMEQAIIVLCDVVKGEKIFFAKMALWSEYVERVQNSVRHMDATLEKKQT